MKIGGVYEAAKILPRHFEKLAEEAGLAKPIVVKRVVELAEIVMATLDKVEIDHPVARAIAVLIESRCKKILSRFNRSE